MEMLATVLVFLAITVIAVRMHLRKTKRSPSSSEAAEATRSCPRCGALVPAAVTTCASCGVPLQAYEVVSAQVALDDAGQGAADGQRLHPLVRADVCVGCGTCVAACPEPGAIFLVDNRAIVDKKICVGHGKCAEACPVGAIILTTGEAVQRVEVPEVDAHFQSNVPGLYIVGELGGRGLIKNAINEGKIAAEHIAREIGSNRSRQGGEPGIYDVAIVGTGPAGLSAALEAKRSGLSYVVLERGSVADTIRKYPRHKILLAEPVRMPLYGDLWVADASKESLLKVWEMVIAQTGLDVRTGHEVTGIARSGDLFTLEAGGETFRARRVVLATGRRGTPRRLGVPGEDLAKVVYDVLEMEMFAGRRVLIVGGGDSAVESAVGMARQAGAEVTLSYRGDGFARIKSRNKEKLDAVVRSGKVRLLLRSQVREIREDAVILDADSRIVTMPNDDVIVRVGGEAPYEFLKRVGVRLVKKDVRIDQGIDQAAD